MNKAEIKTRVKELLLAGTAKAEVFAQFSGKGLKDSQLAYFIAAHPNPARCDEHSGKVNILITVMFIQSLIGFLLGFGIGAQIGLNAKWIMGIFIALIPLLLAWCFYANRVGAYNAYILLSIAQLPKSFEGFSATPVASSIGIAIGIGLLSYVWYIRDKIFPGFMFMGPRKIKGTYVFAD